MEQGVEIPSSSIQELQAVAAPEKEVEPKLRDLRAWLQPAPEPEEDMGDIVMSVEEVVGEDEEQVRQQEQEKVQQQEQEQVRQQEQEQKEQEQEKHEQQEQEQVQEQQEETEPPGLAEEDDEPVDEEEVLINRIVMLIWAGDMAALYMLLGLSGAAGHYPSLYTLVTKAHLRAHANHLRPHNWEEKDCRFPFRYPEQLHSSDQACSRDTRNGGDKAKNAHWHLGSKAAPLIPFPKGIKDLLSLLAPCLLHIDLGIVGKFFLDHAEVMCRILDKTASEAELALLRGRAPRCEMLPLR
jgi:hypothetical protein